MIDYIDNGYYKTIKSLIQDGNNNDFLAAKKKLKQNAYERIWFTVDINNE